LGLFIDKTYLYIADKMSHRIRKMVLATGAVTTIAGTGAQGYMDGNSATATFYEPSNITSDGKSLYVTDSATHIIRKID
jgi:hypothetical protein